MVSKLWFALNLHVATVACSSSKKEPEENPNILPANYKDEILATMANSLDDPTNIRAAYISDPVIRPAGKEERYVVCVRSDSRNLNKQYTGTKDRIAFFYAGH